MPASCPCPWRVALAWLLVGWAPLVAVPSMAAPGLNASYFNSRTFTAPAALSRIDATVNYNWGNGSPGAGVNADDFSARWTGFAQAQTTGNYSFQTYSDDGIRLWINNVLVVDNWTDHGPTYNNSAFSVIPASNGRLGLSTSNDTVPPLDHLEIQHASGTGLTCTPSTVTVRACQDAACSTRHTGGVSGTLGATGGSVVWPATAAFSIAAGSSSTTLSLQATTTIAAPHSLAVTGVTAGPIKAGSPFAATVSARYAAGGITPNFGRESVAETVTLAWVRLWPFGQGTVDGLFSGNLSAFANGTASASNLAWREVGNGDLLVRLTSGNYLGSGLNVVGSSAALGARPCAVEGGICLLSAGAAKPRLRSQNGSCAATADRDPAARASFGISSPETRQTVHARDRY